MPSDHFCARYESGDSCVVCGRRMVAIDAFKGPYAFLSNFYPAPVAYEGVTYPTVENAYQAAKTEDPKAREFFRTCTPGQAKRNAPHRPEGWFDRSLAIMLHLLREKFTIPELREQLLETGNLELIEGNTWGDTFFGVCEGRGENHLGKLLMKVRHDFRPLRIDPVQLSIIRDIFPQMVANEIISVQPMIGIDEVLTCSHGVLVKDCPYCELGAGS